MTEPDGPARIARADFPGADRVLTPDARVFLTDLARHLSVPTPTMDAVIHIASIVAGQDFATQRARTMDNMGLSGLTREQLAAF